MPDHGTIRNSNSHAAFVSLLNEAGSHNFIFSAAQNKLVHAAAASPRSLILTTFFQVCDPLLRQHTHLRTFCSIPSERQVRHRHCPSPSLRTQTSKG